MPILQAQPSGMPFPNCWHHGLSSRISILSTIHYFSGSDKAEVPKVPGRVRDLISVCIGGEGKAPALLRLCWSCGKRASFQAEGGCADPLEGAGSPWTLSANLSVLRSTSDHICHQNPKVGHDFNLRYREVCRGVCGLLTSSRGLAQYPVSLEKAPFSGAIAITGVLSLL